MQHTSGEFEALLDQIEARLLDEVDLIANIAIFTALLFEGMEAVDWVGVYFLRDDELVLGPFQGRAVLPRLALQHPLAGRAVNEARSILTDDLSTIIPDDEFPARSQIIVPVFVDDRIVGVLQVDSPFVHRFAEADRVGLERAVSLLISHCDISSFDLKKIAADAKRRGQVRAATAKAGGNKSAEAGAGTKASNNGALVLEPQAAPAHASPRTTPIIRGTIRPPKKEPSRGRYEAAPAPAKDILIRQSLAVGVALVFFGLALSGASYDTTLIFDQPWQIAVRKIFGVIGFAITGLALNFAWRLGLRRTIALMTVLSLLIELSRFVLGARDGILLNFFDVLCGALGGYLATVGYRATRRARTSRH